MVGSLFVRNTNGEGDSEERTGSVSSHCSYFDGEEIRDGESRLYSLSAQP